MRRYLLLIGFFMLMGAQQVLGHAFYLSIIKVKYDADAQKVEVRVQTFTDDLENALKNAGFEAPGLIEKQYHEQVDEYIEQYVQSIFYLKVDGVALNPQFVKKEQNEEAVFSHFVIENVAAFGSAEVQTSLLTELFDDQTNVVRFMVNGEKKFVNLTKSVNSEKLNF